MTIPKVNRSLGIRKANPKVTVLEGTRKESRAVNAIVATPVTIEIVDNASAELVTE
jgi:hypothetical protein